MKMKNMDIFKKTMPFVWSRFGLYLLLGLGIVVYYILALLLIGVIGSESGFGFLGFIILLIGIAIYIATSRYFNYLVKAAHVAVIAELAEKGSVPEGTSIVKYGKEQVKKRFATATVFYALDGLVSGAVSQIQKVISKIGSWFEKIPAMKTVFDIINLFVGIVLGYVDEAVLAHIFTKKDESAWKGAADGVVLYFESWKEILKNAVGLVIFVILFYLVGGVAVYLIAYGIVAATIATDSIWVFLITFIIALVIVNAFKASFVDSWLTISVVNKYTQVTYNKQPQFDLYNKAKGWSRKFSKICSNAEAEGAVLGAPVVVAGGVAQTMTQPQYQQPVMQQQYVQPAVEQPQMNNIVQPQYQQPVTQQQYQQPMMQQQVQPVAPQMPQAPVQPVQQPQFVPQQATVTPTVTQAQPVQQGYQPTTNNQVNNINSNNNF